MIEDTGETGAANGGDHGSVVTARGTVEGLVIRIDGRVKAETIEQSLKEFVSTRSRFLTGNEVAIEWLGIKPTDEVMGSIIQGVFEPYQVRVKSSRLKDSVRVIKSSAMPAEAQFSGTPSLFDGLSEIGAAEMVKKTKVVSTASSPAKTAARISEAAYAGDVSFASDSALWDEPDSRIIYSTLRSGQRIESAHSVIIIGDVNSGAEVIAGGDIFIWGTLRGIAHAGAYDDDGGGRVIVALVLLPTQLRIGSIISRGGGDGGKHPEIARVDGENIIVEPYRSRSAFQRGPRTSI
jgi:septum site-determining protein MinC